MPVLDLTDAVKAYRPTLGWFTRRLPALAWLWSLYCVVLSADYVIAGSMRHSEPLLGIAVFVTIGLLFLAPAVALAPVWAQERERGTLTGLALAPLSSTDLWVLVLRARVLPSILGLAPGAISLVVGICLVERMGNAGFLALLLILWWVLNGAAFAFAVAAWTATYCRTTATCVAVALVVTLGGELLLLIGSGFLLVLLSSLRLPEFLAIVLGFLLPCAGNAFPASRLATSAANRLADALAEP